MTAIKRKSKIYFSVLILIFVSGNPVLNNTYPIKFSLPALLIILLLLYGRNLLKARFLAPFGFLVTAFSISILAQIASFGVFNLAMVGIFMKLTAGSIVIYSLGQNFSKVFFWSMVFLAILSFPFYASQFFLNPDFFPSLVPTFSPTEKMTSVFFHTYIRGNVWRNSGIFWEPGAFQGFLNLAILLNSRRFLLAKKNRIGSLIIFTTIITTFSTTGFIVLFTILIAKFWGHRGQLMRKSFVVFLVAPLGVLLFIKLDFLFNKIANEFQHALSSDVFTPSRMGSFLFDLQYIQKRPLTGNGFSELTRYADHPWLQGVNLGHGNGFSGFIVSMGLISLCAYLITIYRSSFFTSKKDSIVTIIIILIMLQGQHFLNLPLFLGLPFLNRNQVFVPGVIGKAQTSLESRPITEVVNPVASSPFRSLRWFKSEELSV